jgi:hypothetical protein
LTLAPLRFLGVVVSYAVASKFLGHVNVGIKPCRRSSSARRALLSMSFNSASASGLCAMPIGEVSPNCRSGAPRVAREGCGEMTFDHPRF